ncbi:MAG: TIGR00269 family protein [Thermoplasmata archaeon]|nr:TIGR00269 family protein [Thermoplasmata archaeon]
MIACDRCGKPSIILVRYSGQHLCEEHFRDFFEKRVSKEIRASGKMQKGDKLAIAVSGGKDSMVMLRLLHNIFHARTGIGIHPIIADEGIAGYREKGIEATEKECRSLDVSLELVSFKEMFGYTMDEAVAIDPDTVPCTYCGVFRRQALNRIAKKIGAVKLAFGHNLNDTAGSVLMNICRGDVERLARLGPHEKGQPGLVRRILPLRTVPEEECALYAIIEEMEILVDECPYAYRAHRGEFVKLMAELEDVTPGTRHSILSSYDKLREPLKACFEPANLIDCEKCGEPSMASICKACELIEKLDKLAK